VRREHAPFRQIAAIGVILALVTLSSGCFWSKRSEKPAARGIEVMSITPSLWLSPSITTAALSYNNACGQPAMLLIADPLVETVPKKLSRAFTGITPQYGLEQTAASDGVIEVGLGLKRIDLVIPQQAKGTYPATVTLGMEVAFLAEDGTFLFNAKLQGTGRGDVEVMDQSCEVKGLEAIVQKSIEAVSDSLLKQVAESARIREYAQQKTVAPSTAAATPTRQATVPPSGVALGGMPATGIVPSTGLPASAGSATQTTVLAFHAIVRDESRDHMLQQDEALTIEVEVKNEGQVEAKDVEVVVGGGGTLAEHFPSAVSIGNVQPGEIKHASITNRVTDLKEALRGELVLSVRSATPLVPPSPPKKFTLLIKPDKGIADAVASDIDQPPRSLGLSKQTRAVVIAIGVGSFRNEQVPPVKYAGRDAKVMADYLRAIVGIPDDRVHLLIDSFALKEDIAEAFDEWLPKHADAATVVYVFFAGRALVDGTSGAVSLVPFDGATKATKRLYPVRRMQESLSRLPIQRAIMMFDVSLDPSPGANPAATPHADWGEGADEEKDQVMWMVGNRSLQEAHAYEPGKHGLFTYHLLRGMQGLADIDRDGTVVAGELCTYARNEVIHAAREQFGNAQHPLCSPPPGQGAVVRIHPMARGNNPKPSAPAKKTEPEAIAPPKAQQPMNVGPRP
jgi:hypothetical protein